ncbi:MAG TPA: DUF58 domain-containing protein [Fimbriimonadaceae bacterium]|nr:DUF58 domain-containing protein [Fimbriimonadaceae bacterium]
MRNPAGVALTTAALFLALVAVLLYSNSLFYMSTAMIATIAASRIQAHLSVRGLRFERTAPEAVSAGELVTVEITVWSERQIRRPLVTILDGLPKRLPVEELSLSLPIAPAFDIPVRTQYQFRPMKRGRYSWNTLTVVGTDALGLVSMQKSYQTAPAELTVLPNPLPVNVELPTASGWGTFEVEHGKSRGAGMEPRGIREYASGDPMRHVHWRSSARTGQLLVKEFEAGAQGSAAFVIQQTSGSEVGRGAYTTLEIMCGHMAYLSDKLLRQGTQVYFPGLESGTPRGAVRERIRDILELLASVQADKPEPVSEALSRARMDMPPGSVVYVLVALADPGLPAAIERFRSSGNHLAVLIYDPRKFAGHKTPLKGMPASDIEFMERLRTAGASVISMPVEVRDS